MADKIEGQSPKSEKLRQDIIDTKTPRIDFLNRAEMIRSLQGYARSDITEADVPLFDGSIQFENEEYIALVKSLEQGRIEEKQNIIRDAISKKTAGKVHELKTDIDTEKLQVKEALKDLAPEKIESSLLSTEKLLRMVPSQHETLLRGYAGSLILETFEKHNQRIVLKANNELEVNPMNQAHTDPKLLENNILLRLKLNTLLKDGALNPDMLRIGMLYRAKSFIDYSNAVRSEDGSVMNPNDVKEPNKYFEHLQNLKQNTGYKLSLAEETLLASREGFTDFNAMLPAIQHVKDLGQIQKVAQTMNENSSGQSGYRTSSEVGEGIGKIGGTIGKIAAAGAGGGIKVLGDIFATATKEGGAWGSLAVIGGLIAAIWKGGLWKTLGAIFGIGIISEASAGRLDLDFGTKSRDKKDAGKKADKSKPSEGEKPAPEAKDIPSSDTNYTSFLTTAAGFAADKIQESKDMLAKFDNLTFSEIESFLKEGEGKVTANISAVLGDKINPEFAQKKAVLEKYIAALTKKDADGGGFGNIIEKIKQEPNYVTWTMKQVREYTFDIKERAAEVADKAELLAKKATTPEDAAAAKQIGADVIKAAENGDVEGVHWYSATTSWLNDNQNLIIAGAIGIPLVWSLVKKLGENYKNWGVVKASNWVGGKFVGGYKNLKGRTPASTVSPTEPKPEVKKPSENVAIKKTLNVDRSVLEISSLTPAEKTALESVIKKTERLSDLEDKLLVAGKTEKFGILREKITLGKEIQEILKGSPELIRKLKIEGEAGNKIAQELAIFAEKINKIEVGVLISKIIKIFKKV